MYSNLSNNNRQLDRQFNQLLNAYNNVDSNILNTQNLIYGNRFRRNYYPRAPITTNKYRYLNNNTMDYNTLQKKINNSLYPSQIKSNYNFQKRNPYSLNSLNNIGRERNNVEKLYPSNPVLEDFKNTLMKTQNLANKLFNQNNNFRFNNKYNNFVGYDTYNNYLDSDFESNNSFLDYENSDNSLDLDYEDENDDYQLPVNEYIGRKKIDISLKNQLNKNEENKLKSTNTVLSKSNNDLKNENRVLEVEISNYKIQENNKNPNFTHFDANLQKFINSVKTSLKESLKINLDNSEKLLDLTKENQNLFNRNEKLSKTNGGQIQKIEGKNRLNAEIQIQNEENENKINNLTEEQKNLNDDLEKMKIELLDLQSKEKKLNLMKETNIKKKQDNEEILYKLNNTINQLSNESQKTNQKSDSNTQKIQNDFNSLNIYDQKIKDLNNLIQKITSDKNSLLQDTQEKRLKLLQDNSQKAPTENQQKQSQLKSELALIQNQNNSLQNELTNKENEIQNLKNTLDKTSNALKSNNPNENIQKLNLENLIKPEPTDEKKLDEDIQNAVKENISKSNETQKINQMYMDIIQQKENTINMLEQQSQNINNNEEVELPPLIDKINKNSLKNNNNNLKDAIQSYSINELSLGSGENNNNNDMNQNIYNNNNELNDENQYINNEENINEEIGYDQGEEQFQGNEEQFQGEEEQFQGNEEQFQGEEEMYDNEQYNNDMQEMNENLEEGQLLNDNGEQEEYVEGEEELYNNQLGNEQINEMNEEEEGQEYMPQNDEENFEEQEYYNNNGDMEQGDLGEGEVNMEELNPGDENM